MRQEFDGTVERIRDAARRLACERKDDE